VANVPFAAAQELAYLYLLAQHTHSETPARRPAGCYWITAPPGHEKYFDELRDLIAKGGKPDPDALAKLRAKYDTVQLATLTPG
jgi:hypothetical protein